MKSFSSYIKFGIPGIIVGILISTGVQFVFSWTSPTQAPPQGNTDTPLNVSAVDQTKAGSLTLGVSVLSPIFYDANDTGYFIDPNAMSYLTNSVNYGYIYTTGNNWGLLTYGAGFNANSDPRSIDGSIYTNDIYLRSIGMWASQLSGGGGGSVSGGGGGSVTVIGGATCYAHDSLGRLITMRSGEMLPNTLCANGSGGLCYCFDGTVTQIIANDTSGGGGDAGGSGGGSD